MIKDNSGSLIVVDGEIKTVEEAKYKQLRGMSIYEVLRVIDGKPLFLKEHIERLINSFSITKSELPDGIKDIDRNILFFINEAKIKNGNIKIICDGIGEESKRTIIYEAKSNYPRKELYKRGVAVSTLKMSRLSPGAKIVEASIKKEADIMKAKNDVYEVLLVDEKGNVTEGSRSNIFFVRNGALHTTPLKQVLPGITRMKVLEFCAKKGIEVKVHVVKEEDLKSFDGAFLTGTSINILPIKEINGFSYSGDGFAFELSYQFNEFINEEIVNA